MAARSILGALACVFLVLGATARLRRHDGARLQSRTWLLVGVIFGLVTVWLWYRA